MSDRSLQNKIIEFLKIHKYASTRRIARELKKPYSTVYNALLALYMKKIVDCKLCVERYPTGVGFLKVRYWWLRNA